MKPTLLALAGLSISLSAAIAQPKPQDPNPAKPAPTKAGGEVPVPYALPDLSKEPTLFVVGYAHLDTQWRWTYQDTLREYIPDTLRDNFKLFDKYPHYVFNFSGSRRYKMMQEYYPDDYKKMKAYVAAGRWFPCGSSVDENDANVPSAESLVRHVLYGNRFFMHEFGLASQEYMLPDCFGFPAALPSVLAHCGVKGFSTQKLTWNAVVPIPFKVGVWQGPDGRSVIAALDPGAYVGDVKTNLANDGSWLERIRNNGKQSGTFVDYHYFGTGDQGGAPKDATVAKVEESVGTDGAIKVISAPADAMFKAITPERAERLPTYKGELELIEHSAGSISSQAYMKRWNRKNELLADSAERASVAAWWMGGRDYPTQRLEDAWYLLLGSQMHDILPGTSVPRAYDFSWNDECIAANQFAGILQDAASSVISGMDTRSTGTTLVVYNALGYEREDIVEADVPTNGAAPKGVKVTGPTGPALAQMVGDPNLKTGTVRIAFLAKAPSSGFASYSVELTAAEQPAASNLKVSEHDLENDSYLVRIDNNGDVSSIFDKAAKKELLSAPARTALCYENPRNWPAWNQDWADRQLPPKSFVSYAGGAGAAKVVERGPARIAVEITREAEGSTFTQRISLAGGSGDAGKRVEFDTDINWRTRERSVRASFPLAVSNPQATYDIQTGAIDRPNGSAKQFEYPFHQWFDLSSTGLPPGADNQRPSDSSYGVTVMCDSKYAADKPNDNTVRLTLLHTPGARGGYPDQASQDLGRHHVVYALTGHAGTWQKDHTYTQAQRLNQPLAAFRAAPHDGPLGKSFSLAGSSNPAVTISAIKKAEDGDEIIVRLREQTGAPAKGVRITLGSAVTEAREVDGQEREISKAKVTDGALVADIGGFELRAFALKLAKAPAQLAKVESKPVTLPYDSDVAASRASRTDGAIDDQGRALPAEQLPSTLTDGPITFTLGNAADGQKNAVSCQGQDIALPSGSWDRLYILASANGDVPAAIEIDGKPAPFTAQNWTGFVGQWDHRVWPGNWTDPKYPWNKEPIGLEPGFVKQAPIAWFCSHHSTKSGDALYEYSYIFKHAFDLPQGVKQVRLPNDSRIKVFAISVAKAGPSADAATPLFDTLADHTQDGPRILPGPGSFDNMVSVKIEPSLYWKEGAVRYTTSGADPTPQSDVYTAPIWIMSTSTIKAAIVGPDGKLGPVASSRLEVNDKKGPSFDPKIGFGYQSSTLQLKFNELLDVQSIFPSNFKLEPAIEIKKVGVAKGNSNVTLDLASPPKVDQTYKLTVSGIRDYSNNKNVMEPQTVEFTVRGPVFELADAKPGAIKDTKGLPIKANDRWTMNMFVKTDKQPQPRTVIAGFGRCVSEQANPGNGRYLCRFPGGIHFWSHNQDAPTRTPLDLDKWQMLTVTYDGQSLRLYKNGEKIGERGIALSDDENIINIAPKDPWDHERQFSGDIRSFTIWGSALGDDTVKSLMSGMPK